MCFLWQRVRFPMQQHGETSILTCICGKQKYISLIRCCQMGKGDRRSKGQWLLKFRDNKGEGQWVGVVRCGGRGGEPDRDREDARHAMTYQEDSSRLLQLTLLGDREAAKVLKVYAERRADVLLTLVASATLWTLPWEQVWPVLLKVRADTVQPELLAHLKAKLPKYRPFPNHQEMVNGLEAHRHSALFPLVTGIWWSGSWTSETWEIVRTSRLDALESFTLWGLPAWFKMQSLDLNEVPWLGDLRELAIRAMVYSPDSTNAPPPPAFGPLVEQMAKRPMPALRFLDFTGGTFVPGALASLCAAPWSAQLERLGLDRNYLSASCLEALAGTTFPALRILQLNQPQIPPQNLAALACAPFFTKLQMLQLSADENNIVQAIALIPADMLEARLILLSNCTSMSKPDRFYSARNTVAYAPAVRALGAQFRPHLSALEAMTRTRHQRLTLAKGAERAMMCVLLNHPSLALQEQNTLSALAAACAQSQALVCGSFALIFSHISDTATLARLCAQLLAHPSTQHVVRESHIMRADFVRDDNTRAIQQQVLLTLLATVRPRAQNVALQFLTRGQHTAQRDALKPWLCAALTDPTRSGPGAQAFPSVAWPNLQYVDGLFRAVWPLVREDAAQAQPILEGALLLARKHEFKNISHLRWAALAHPAITEAVLKIFPPDTRNAILLNFVQKDRRPLMQLLEQSATTRALCPPWNADWPEPPRKHERRRWNVLSELNASASLRTEGEAARERFAALLTHDNKHLRDLARQSINALDHVIKSALKNAAVAPST